MSQSLGLLAFTEGMRAPELASYGQRLEALGYDTVWVPEVAGREPFATCGYLVARTERIQVGTGIVNAYVRDAAAAAQGRQTLAELSGGRFLLGIGISHPILVEPRGHGWLPPLTKMRSYLEGIRAVQIDAPAPEREAPIVLAAHGPKLLQLAATQADGAFVYLMPPAYIAQARQALGPDKRLYAVLRCTMCEDPDRARRLVREMISFYVELPAYHRVWRTCGFTDADFKNGGSDRLLEAAIAWGDKKRIGDRIAAYFEAGASQVVLAPTHPEEESRPGRAGGHLLDWNLLEALAPGA